LSHAFVASRRIVIALQELELEWEGVRDLKSIALALKEHRSLTRLNLTHNEASKD